MVSLEALTQLQKSDLQAAPTIVWTSANTGKQARVPSMRQCPNPACKLIVKIKGGNPGEHGCRIVHCPKCTYHFCYMCLGAQNGGWTSIPCAQRVNVWDVCPNPVSPN